jgi:GDPmannose 4,6-dehydratase
MLTILITGITGQDGYNMARFLLKKFNQNIKIIGCYNTENKLKNISDIIDKIILYKLNLLELEKIDQAIFEFKPNYIFNFSSAQPQFENDNINFFKINTLSTIQFLESILKYNTSIRYFSAGSCLEYKNNCQNINLTDCPEPTNIYGITKLSNRYIVNYYREKYNIFGVHAILFNHDSASRTDDFISKKIISHLKKIVNSADSEKNAIFEINNVFTFRDWSDSRDFIEGIWLMMTHNYSSNYILSSGKEHSILNFINVSMDCLNLKNYKWEKKDNTYCLYYNNHLIIKSLSIEPVHNVIGDNNDTITILNWKPKFTFNDMVRDMINEFIY